MLGFGVLGVTEDNCAAVIVMLTVVHPTVVDATALECARGKRKTPVPRVARHLHPRSASSERA